MPGDFSIKTVARQPLQSLTVGFESAPILRIAAELTMRLLLPEEATLVYAPHPSITRRWHCLSVTFTGPYVYANGTPMSSDRHTLVCTTPHWRAPWVPGLIAHCEQYLDRAEPEQPGSATETR